MTSYILSGTLAETRSYGCLVGASSRVVEQWQKILLPGDVQTYVEYDKTDEFDRIYNFVSSILIETKLNLALFMI